MEDFPGAAEEQAHRDVRVEQDFIRNAHEVCLMAKCDSCDEMPLCSVMTCCHSN